MTADKTMQSLSSGTLHKLFSESFYRSSHSDLPNSLPSFLHFLKHGIDEGRDPNPFFSFSFIRDQSPDCTLSNLEILINRDFLDSIQTSHYFDSSFYREANHEVLEKLSEDSTQSALAHYLQYGYQQALRTTPNLLVIPKWLRAKLRQSIDCSKLVTETIEQERINRKILVTVPVYKDLEKTRSCLQSLYASGIPSQARVLVINDASPDQELVEYLTEACNQYAFKLISNDSNLGFIGTVNRANQLRTDNEDLLIVNSDTISPPGLIARLSRYLDRDSNIATVTPLSNNATIATVPCIGEGFSIFTSHDLEMLDRAAGYCQSAYEDLLDLISIPTGVGFCMLINHKAIADGPLFDASLFGKGYGEEVHFCLSASKNGFLNILAPDIFVWHHSGASFGHEKWELIRSASQTINRIHPDYDSLVNHFCCHDRLLTRRVLITLLVLAENGSQGSLIITHDLGGGIERYILDRTLSLTSSEYLLILRPSRCHQFVELELTHNAISIRLAFEVTDASESSVVIRDLFNIRDVEIHSAIGHDLGFIYALIQKLELPYQYYIHDYHALCPRIVPRDQSDIFCGIPDAADCNRCLLQTGEEIDIAAWRHRFQWMLYGASDLIAPSRNTAELYRSTLPGLEPKIIPHENQDDIIRVRISNITRLQGSSLLAQTSGIVVLGSMAAHKGLRLLEEVAMQLSANKIKLTIIGSLQSPSMLSNMKNVLIHGAYVDKHLNELLDYYKPAGIFFPARIPETYSYTLTAALQSGYSVLAPNVGAFTERLSNIPKCRLYRLSDSAEHITSMLINISLESTDSLYADIKEDLCQIISEP